MVGRQDWLDGMLYIFDANSSPYIPGEYIAISIILAYVTGKLLTCTVQANAVELPLYVASPTFALIVSFIFINELIRRAHSLIKKNDVLSFLRINLAK
jgi:hypothetical protein